MLVALLVIALVCLAVGLVLPSVAWLIASLIATAGAGYLLLKARSTILAPSPAGGPGESPAAMGETTVLPRLNDQDDAAVASDSRGAEHAGPTATADPEAATSADRPPEAPRDAGSGAGAGDRSGVGGSATDGYVPGPDDVWVIDGRPRYHLQGCVIIQGQDAEPIPFDQAVEDGFMPCSLCEPQLARAAARDI